MTKINPAKFITEVRQEIGKVSWPTRKETTVSTAMVLALVTAASAFFVLVDWVVGSIIRAIIGLA